MELNRFFLSASDAALLLRGEYNLVLVLLSVLVAVLAGVMTFQLAGMARTEARSFNRQSFLFSGAFVLGSGVWSMHFIGMLAYSVCSSVEYDTTITLASMLPSFSASWVALQLLSKERVTTWELLASGVLVGAGIGVMHYSGLAAVYQSLTLRFEPVIFAVSIVVAVVLSVLALWLRFRLTVHSGFTSRQINLPSGVVLGVAISGMHYTGMAATGFLMGPGGIAELVSNFNLALSIAGMTVLGALITVAGNLLLRFRSLYQRMVQTEARTRTILETAVDGIVTVDSKGVIRDFNKAAQSIFGWPAQEVVGQHIDVLVPVAHRGQRETYLQSYFSSEQIAEARAGREIVGLRKDGSHFPMRLAIGRAPLKGETLFVGFITDISERKQMEIALRKSEQQHRSLIANLPGVAFRGRLDKQGSMLFVSDAVVRLTGWTPADFVEGDKTFAELIHPDDRDWVATTTVERLHVDNAYMMEYRILDRAGHEHWVSESASSVRGDSGELEWVDGVIIDITESKRRNAEFEGVVNAINRSLAVVEFDLYGTILNANSIFQGITGYPLEELQGRHHAILCTPAEVQSKEYQEFWSTLRQGNFAAGDFHRIAKGGRDIWIHGSYNPIYNPQGQPYKIVKFASDLTDRYAMEQDLRDAKAKAEQAAAAKNTFLANMSHEIRTPMNAVIGFTDVLLDAPASDSQRRHLTTVRNAARSLLTLLNDILDTAKLERGAVELETKDFSLREVCMQVLATLRVNAQGKGLPLVLDYADTEREFFKGDALRIQQILINLVGNAIKFTEKGQVSLRVHQHAGVVHMVVQDTGIGIAPDRISHIFDPFAQADASMTRRFGGTGLGTTIARQLIELMQGRIWVESALGVGSQFHVELPLADGEAVGSAWEQVVVDLPPLRILAADDVPQNLELLELLLNRYGHALTTAGNGEEAIAAFMAGSFDIVLMDVQMPVLTGLEASSRIRQWEAETGRVPTPIIAFSASVLEEDVKEAYAAGMNGFSSKPVDLYHLTHEIARLLGIAITTRASAAQQVAAHNTEPVVRGSVIDWHTGRQLWGSEQRHREAIRRFLVDYGDAVPRLRQTMAVPAELAAQVHKLKGTAANLALSRTTSLSASLERELAAGSPDALPDLLNQLADELGNVRETVSQLVGDAVGDTVAAAPEKAAVDAARLLPVLDELDDALARGELPEHALSSLSAMLPDAEYRAMDDAINTFDFELARQLLADLRNRYRTEEPAP